MLEKLHIAAKNIYELVVKAANKEKIQRDNKFYNF